MSQIIPITTNMKCVTEVTKEISLDYDTVVVVSGDCFVHESFNRCAKYEEPFLPLPLPTGSGNGYRPSSGVAVLIGSRLRVREVGMLDGGGD